MDRRRLALALAAAALLGPWGGAPARGRPAADDRIGPGWRSMDDDIVLVGPAADPAGVSGLRDAAEALRRIAAVGAAFASPVRSAGAPEAETRLWRAAGVDPARGRGRWYRQVNGGAAAALEAAAAQDAYALVERGAWLALRSRRNLRVLVEGDGRLPR